MSTERAWSTGRRSVPRMALLFALALLTAVVVNGAVQPLFAASPSLSVTASASTEVGLQIFAVSNIQSGVSPTGTITFDLYGPADPTCTASLRSSAVPVNGNGAYNAPPFQTSQAGTYRWIARYSGDANNTAAATSCSDPAAAVIVDKADTVLTTQASDPAVLGGPIHDDATLTGGLNPTGTMTFNVYGPADTICAAAPVDTSTVAVNGNGSYRSEDYTPTQIGVHRWRAMYSGDLNNLAVTITPCLDALEISTVSGLGPTLVTTASAATVVGGQVTDTAVLAGANNPTGTITFRLYGPADVSCSGTPVSQSTRTVAGNGSYTSQATTVTSPGTYRYVASYSGDANNAGVANSCNDPLESVLVSGGTTTTMSSTTTTTATSTTTTTVPTTTTTVASTTTTTTSAATTTTTRATTTTTSTTTTSPTSTTTTTRPVPTSATTTTSPTTPSTTSTSTPAASTSTSTSTSTSSTTTTTTLPVATGTTLPPVPTVSVSPNPVPAGQNAVVTGTGFPLGPADLTLFSTPAFLGRVIVGPSGTFSVAVTIPADTPPGSHRLVVTGILGNILAEVAVVVTPPTGAPVVTVAPPTPIVTILGPVGTAVAQGANTAVQLVRTGTDIADPAGTAMAIAGLGLLLARTRPAGPRHRRFPWG